MLADSRDDDRATDPGAFAALETLFERVIGLDGEARARAMADAAVAHPDLYAQLGAMVSAHERLSRADDATDEVPSSVGVGSRIGGYRVVDRLGAGGMGEVFRAERADGAFDAEVAIKVTRANLSSEDLRRRFRVERQILASLHHPNVVRLLDGGATDSGQAYLIMEHVGGVPVTQYCRAQRLSLAARLEMFRAVCDAVQHAHQRGVVHRDLKPENVLVGADGVPKVLDFGIAKLLDDDPAGGGTMTVGAMAAPLTPNYASPEQLRGLPVTTAADLYALGVMLYELVAGVRPYETEGQPLDRVLEIVMHGEPRRPSAAGTVADALPYSRTALRGDVDAIVMKAIAKDPAHRYTSAAELAADLGRFVAGDPVLARPPSVAYVLRRLGARHKAVVSVTALALIAIVTALGGALWQRQVAREAQARAEQRLRDVRQLANALIFKIDGAVAPLQGSTPVRRTIVDEAIGYLERLEAESEGDLPLRLELAAAYRRLGGILGDPRQANLGDRAGAVHLYERSGALVMPHAGPGAHPDVVDAVVDGHTGLAVLYSQQGAADKALHMARESLTHATRLETERPGDSRAASVAARASFTLATMLPPGEAKSVWEETLGRYERLLAANPADPVMQRNVALVGKYLGTTYENQGDLDRAQQHYTRSRDLDEKRLIAAPDDQRVQFDAAISFSSSASIASKLGDYDTASRDFDRSLALRRALAEADPKNMQARHRLGYLLGRIASHHRERQPQLAREHAREAIDVLRTVLAATGDRRSQLDLGHAWLQAGITAEIVQDGPAACAAFREAERHYAAAERALPLGIDTRFANDAKRRAARCASSAGAAQ